MANDDDYQIEQDVPHAHSIVVARCNDPECSAVHIVLEDKDDVQIAAAALTEAQVRQIAEAGGYELHRKQ
jgi:hypothetical protein